VAVVREVEVQVTYARYSRVKGMPEPLPWLSRMHRHPTRCFRYSSCLLFSSKSFVWYKYNSFVCVPIAMKVRQATNFVKILHFSLYSHRWISICEVCVSRLWNRDWRQDLYPDLNVLDMVDFEVILEMDWLAKHRASVNCWGKKIIFNLDKEIGLVFQGDKIMSPSIMLSAISR